MNIKNFENLQGNFLVASPIVTDNRFKRKMVFLTEVRNQSAFGFIIGDELAKPGLKRHLKSTCFEDEEIYYGGPVEEGHVFVLHSNEVVCKQSAAVNKNIYVTNLKDALADPKFKTPKNFKLLAGYAHWKNMQLHKEITLSYWIADPFDYSTLFKGENNWHLCMQKNNISPFNFSLFSGAC